MITGDVNYSDPIVQEQLMDLHQEFENLTYVAGALYTESWLRAWLGFLDRNQEFLELNVTTEEDFIANLREVSLCVCASVPAYSLLEHWLGETFGSRTTSPGRDIKSSYMFLMFG